MMQPTLRAARRFTRLVVWAPKEFIAPRLRSVLIGEHLEMLGVADFVACIDIDPVSETGPTSGLKFPRFPESDFKIFRALRSMIFG
jgi:hypothetical protein